MLRDGSFFWNIGNSREKWKSMRRIIPILLTVFSLAACNFPTRMPELESPPVNPQNCSFSWASQPLPDLSKQVQSAIDAARLTGVKATAEAYGENCYDSQTNKPVSFATLETDFYVTVKVDDLTDKDELGNLLEKILTVLDGLPTGKIPGPEPGFISVSFQSGRNELNLMFIVTAGKTARTLGLHGAALFDELNKK